MAERFPDRVWLVRGINEDGSRSPRLICSPDMAQTFAREYRCELVEYARAAENGSTEPGGSGRTVEGPCSRPERQGEVRGAE
jgi:hypothetical protein